MTDKQLIRDFLDQIIQLKKEIDNCENMREETFFRLDGLELDFNSEKYEDYRLTINECDRNIENCEDMMDALWLKIESMGGLIALEETLAQDVE